MPTIPQPQHLIVLVHGLSDTHHAWDNCIQELRNMPRSDNFLLHASKVNGRLKTHDGFDKCGHRLANEIRELIPRHPHLNTISFIGHSMGGMIARFALGILFRPSDSTICGLQPAHFITLATPHLGLTVDSGPAQVPFVAWSAEVPLLGGPLQRGLQAVAHNVARTVFRGTGRHFLALDGEAGELPLLIRMAMDCPDRNEYFFSALRSFASRACYGNVRGDHWVSWENATLRSTEDLPFIQPDVVRCGRGVVREDSPEVALGHKPPPPLQRQTEEAVIRPRSCGQMVTSPPACEQFEGGSGPSGGVSRRVTTGAATAATGTATTTTATPGTTPSASGPVASAGVPCSADELLAAARHAPPSSHSSAAAAAAAAVEGGLVGRHAHTGFEVSPISGGCGLQEGKEGPEGAVPSGRGGGGEEEEDVVEGLATAGGGGDMGREADEVELEKAAAAAVESPQQVVAFALTRLQLLSWRRVDVSFAGTRMGTAHNNIQATRWTNTVGRGVLAHLRQHLQAVEELSRGRRSAAVGA